jgi:DNA-binding winged helix-turn-helix (wHTH) protein
VPTEPQVVDLLHLLLCHAGTVVSRDRIIEEVWGGRIVSESAISARIAAVRKAVGDDGERQAVIRTLPRRGLMLVAEVEVNDMALAPAASSQVEGRPAIQRIRFARTDDDRALAYAVVGEGPPVLRMAPVMIIELEAEWHLPPERRLIDALSARHRLLRFDYIGSGRSDRSRVETDFAVHAAHARTVALAAGFERFAIFSESGGVLPAVHLAARYPEMVDRLAIVGGYVEGRLIRPGAEAVDPLRAMITQDWEQPHNAFAMALLMSYFPEGPLEAVQDYVRLMQGAASVSAEIKIRDVINTTSIASLLDQVCCPTLIIHGRHDGVHPLSEAQKLAARIPDAELVVLETANHIPLPGNTIWEEYVRTLLDFFDP